MAKPIKETPVLKGADAEAFFKDIHKNETDTSNRVSKESYDRSKKIFEKVMANSNFR